LKLCEQLNYEEFKSTIEQKHNINLIGAFFDSNDQPDELNCSFGFFKQSLALLNTDKK